MKSVDMWLIFGIHQSETFIMCRPITGRETVGQTGNQLLKRAVFCLKFGWRSGQRHCGDVTPDLESVVAAGTEGLKRHSSGWRRLHSNRPRGSWVV